MFSTDRGVSFIGLACTWSTISSIWKSKSSHNDKDSLHAVLNHLPICGTILGSSSHAISLALRSRAAQITALILTLIAGAGCADTSPPPLGADNPGNPQAPEARVKPMSNRLGMDDITKKSRRILAAEGDRSGPVSSDQSQQMQNMPGMQIPRQQPKPDQQPMGQMPGMNMPEEHAQPSPTPNSQ
jgi:hypothetical protein